MLSVFLCELSDYFKDDRCQLSPSINLFLMWQETDYTNVSSIITVVIFHICRIEYDKFAASIDSKKMCHGV